MAVQGLHCCAGFSLAAPSRGYSLVVVCGLLTAGFSLQSKGSSVLGLQELWHAGSGAVARGVRRCGTRGQEVRNAGSGGVARGVRRCGTRGQ